MAAKSVKPVSINKAVLNDLASRFLLNIPSEDQDDPMKLCTHIELAYWFYLDLVRPEDSTLPGCSMKEFMAAMFHHCPFLVKDSVMINLDNYVAQWKAHKYKKPVRGGIILNQDLTKCLLVQGYPASTTWGFPKGKLEEGENDMDAAVREVYEETGFDSRGIIKEKWYLEAQVNGSEAKMYIIPGVPEDTHFEPKTRKEIRSIQWFRVDDLPRHKKDLTSKQALGKKANSFFMILPFISQLRKWVSSHSKSSAKVSKGKTISAHFQNPTQPQAQSHSKTSMQTHQSNFNPQPPPQTSSFRTVSPSAPPLSVISQTAYDYETGHRYGMGYGNENIEHRNLRMGYGSMGMYNSLGDIASHQGNQSPRAPQLSVSAFSRDDAAPIPYPPQYPHTLHPNHTLPAPLHHVTTGHYSPGHAAIYPSHLAHMNSPYTHHNQQQLQHHQSINVQYTGIITPQQGAAIHAHHMPQGDATNTYSPRPAGNLSTYPAAAIVHVHGGGEPAQARRSTPPPPPTAVQQQHHQYYYSVYPNPSAAAPVHLQQTTPPVHLHHHTALSQHHGYPPHHQGPILLELRPQGPTPQTLPPQGPTCTPLELPPQGHALPPQGHPTHPHVHSHLQTVSGNVWRSHIHVATNSQQKHGLGTKRDTFEPTLIQQQVSHVQNQDRSRERVTHGVAALSLGRDDQGGSGADQLADTSGYKVTLKPATSMVKFRFNKEAVLRSSNIKS